ncbi:protein F37C4.5-like isoform X2 [Gigantopelta aegis]|uniref:protein F37C4.5-like isoform X2 n=1 Tax=Gigantopelta aegis TaxID=1735272 RepID=UPI001B887CBA|nr:protein F37C4.5-like isoform X2 [Gigantopelta aegis]
MEKKENVNEDDTFVSSECAVKKVTVYSDRAEVCRLIEADVKKGVNEIVLKQLPKCIDPDSIRVEGKGSATIAEVSYQMKYLPKDEAEITHQEKELTDKIESLKKEKDELDAKLGVIGKQTEVLDNFAKTASNVGSTKNATPPVLDSSFFKGVGEFLQLIGDQGNTLASDRLDIERQVTVLNDKITAANENLNKLRGPRTNLQESRECTIVLECEEKTKVLLTVSYVVTRAAWIPSYDIRMFTAEGTMKIFYYGQIKQSTGEDWNDAKLFLSTATPSVGGVVPELSVQLLSVKYKYASARKKTRTFSMRQYRTMDNDAYMYDDLQPCGIDDYCLNTSLSAGLMDDEPQFEPEVAHATSQVNESTTSATYEIARQSSIPSDDVAHKVSVGILDLKPKLEYITMPKTVPHAFLRARITNTSQFTLLPGSTSIFLDNSFVAKAKIKAVSPGEEFECSLGVDPAVRVTYKPLSKFRESSGIFSKTACTKYKQVTEVKNSHDYAISVELRDQLPRSSDEKIKVTLIEPTIDMKHPEKNQDVSLTKNNHVVWQLKLDKQETREITLRYSVEHPASEEIESKEVFQD